MVVQPAQLVRLARLVCLDSRVHPAVLALLALPGTPVHRVTKVLLVPQASRATKALKGQKVSPDLMDSRDLLASQDVLVSAVTLDRLEAPGHLDLMDHQVREVSPASLEPRVVLDGLENQGSRVVKVIKDLLASPVKEARRFVTLLFTLCIVPVSTLRLIVC